MLTCCRRKEVYNGRPPPGPQLSGGRPAACAPFPIPGSRRCWRDSPKQAGPRVTRPASALPPAGAGELRASSSCLEKRQCSTPDARAASAGCEVAGVQRGGHAAKRPGGGRRGGTQEGRGHGISQSRRRLVTEARWAGAALRDAEPQVTEATHTGPEQRSGQREFFESTEAAPPTAQRIRWTRRRAGDGRAGSCRSRGVCTPSSGPCPDKFKIGIPAGIEQSLQK